MAISSELEQLLASWIPRQPWFPKLAADFGNDPDITPMSVARAFTYTAEAHVRLRRRRRPRVRQSHDRCHHQTQGLRRRTAVDRVAAPQPGEDRGPGPGADALPRVRERQPRLGDGIGHPRRGGPAEAV